MRDRAACAVQEVLATVKSGIVNRVGLTTSYAIEDGGEEGLSSESIVTQVEKIVQEGTQKAVNNGGATWLASYLAGAERDLNREMPVLNKDNTYYIGVVTVPSIGLELPVQATWSYPQLKKTPCRYYGSLFTNNLVIAGHNYKKHFGSLKDLKTGDSVLFTDVEGTIYRFAVAEKEILKPNEVDRLNNSEYPLTLFTCTVGGETRTVIRCMYSRK